MTMVGRDASDIATTTYTSEKSSAEAMADLALGLLRYRVWARFAMHEIRQRFHRSMLGPLWITLSMGILVAALCAVFTTLFDQDIGQTLPYISTGIIFWGLLTSCITEGTMMFTANETNIRNVPQPISVHFYRLLARNIIVWAFNMAIYLFVLVFFHVPVGWSVVYFVPGFFLFVWNVSWIALLIGVLSTRFRDIPPIITNLVQVVFFVTPVFWSTAALSHRPAFVQFNPLYHLLELVRAPLIGEPTSAASWIWAMALALGGTAATLFLYRRAYARIAYWV